MLVIKLEKLPLIILALILFLFPLVNLPWTSNQIELSKQMFLYSSVVILGTSLVFVDFLKKNSLKINVIDLLISLLALSFLISTLAVSGNQSENLLLETFPVLSLLALYLLIRQISTQNTNLPIISFIFSSAVCALIIIFQPFLSNFPFTPLTTQNLQPAPIWYPTGSLFTTLWFTAISLPLALGFLITAIRPKISSEAAPNSFSVLKSYIVAGLAGLFLLLLLSQAAILTRPLLSSSPNSTQPFLFLDAKTGWDILISTLSRHPLLGVGPGNFSDAMTLFKPASYNLTPFWNIRFSSNSNFPFHLGSINGALGLGAYLTLIIFLLLKGVKTLQEKDTLAKTQALTLFFIIFLQFFFPVSFFPLAVFFIFIALVNNERQEDDFEMKNSQLVLNLPLTVVSLILFLFISLNLYRAEAAVQKGSLALSAGNGIETLRFLDQAVKLAPYREPYYTIASQVNLAIAGNILARAATPGAQMASSEAQLVQQYIRISIDQARKSTELSPKRSANWENLAKTYRRVTGLVQGVTPWIATSYQKAIEFDPANPRLQLELGGIFFGEQQYATAAAYFRKAVALKPDYNNARYNLAHALFQLKNYQEAVFEMEKAINLTDPSSPDFARAKAELELFKTELTKTFTPSASEGQIPPISPTPPLSGLSNLGNLGDLASPSSSPTGTLRQRQILVPEEPLNVATGGGSLKPTPF